MTASSLTIAIAGGTGAFLGASLGQAIQWLRDRWMVKQQDRQRRVDHQYQTRLDGYTSILVFLHELNASVLRTADRVEEFAQRGWNRGCFEEFVETLTALDNCFESSFRDARQRSYIYGSSEANAFFTEVYRDYIKVYRDTANLQSYANQYLADPDPETHTDGLQEALKDNARRALPVFRRLEANIETLRNLLRREVGLTD